MTAVTRPTDGDDPPEVIDFGYIRDILVDHAALDPAPITPDATLAQAGVDSMALTVLSMTVEDRLGLLVTEAVLAQAPTVAALAGLVAGRAADHAL
ncbi:hypothetical protein GCM10010145_51800 [Streptomyces ruber]|uniref:Carrier domain-containing protein n=2 Tax=Streptomyces TaxID=1883 RepID=A0A918EWC9_9ACTN|nr:acyl carrier protein [Streptomyces ruber]GGQ75766.1 hypothetical protein GCM10010145_51800 [Streptomyces ruber]